MNESMILHHYDASPYAEKVRLMFGLAGVAWHSMLVPVQPPRPTLDPLTGGYRRIPVAQIGADLYIDTALIARELVARTGCAELDVASLSEDAHALMVQAETKVFFAAIGAVPPLRLLGTMLRSFGPLGMRRFIKDRTSLLKGGTARPARGDRAKLIFEEFLQALEQHLASRDWIDGDAPSVADCAVYHPLWLHASCNRRPLAAGPRVQQWFQRVSELGHGNRVETSQQEVWAAARDNQPQPLAESEADAPFEKGVSVLVAPEDYGVVPVLGTVACINAERIVLRRDTEEFGTVHVHFPRQGYSIRAA